MRRVRWLEASWPYGIRTLASHLKAYSFGRDSDDGFIIERVRDTHIEGKYFERVTFDEIVRDPFGDENTYERVSYREVEFTFSAEFPQIELRKFPRGTQSFVARLSEATSFSSSFVAIGVDVFKWSDAIRGAFPDGFRIDLADLSEVFLEPDVKAKVILSGQKDILSALQKFTGRYRHMVNRIQVRIDNDGTPISFQLSSDGTLRAPDRLPDEVYDAIHRGLLTAKLSP
jgi:hypothetical protein